MIAEFVQGRVRTDANLPFSTSLKNGRLFYVHLRRLKIGFRSVWILSRHHYRLENEASYYKGEEQDAISADMNHSYSF